MCGKSAEKIDGRVQQSSILILVTNILLVCFFSFFSLFLLALSLSFMLIFILHLFSFFLRFFRILLFAHTQWVIVHFIYWCCAYDALCVCVSSWAAGDQLVDILSGMRYASVRMLQVKWFISSIRRANCSMCTIWLLDCLQWGAKTNGIDQMKWNHFSRLFTAIDSVAIEWRRRKKYFWWNADVWIIHMLVSQCVCVCVFVRLPQRLMWHELSNWNPCSGWTRTLDMHFFSSCFVSRCLHLLLSFLNQKAKKQKESIKSATNEINETLQSMRQNRQFHNESISV